MLKQMLQLPTQEQKQYMDSKDNRFILFLCECVLNVMEGIVHVSGAQLEQYEQQLRELCKRNTSYVKRRKILKSANEVTQNYWQSMHKLFEPISWPRKSLF